MGLGITKYVYETVRHCEAYLVENYHDRYRLSKRAVYPFTMEHDLEMDLSSKLSTDEATNFQSIMGLLR